jgi:hypothetical protein
MAVAGNGDLYAVGDFVNVTGTSGAGDKIARWNGTNWSSVGSSSFFGESSNLLRDVVLDGSRVFVVGTFSDAGGKALVDGVAAFVSGSGKTVGTNADGTNGPLSGNPGLRDVERVGSRLYIGGLDQDIGGGVLNDAIAFFRLRQPDALIRTGGSFIGNGVYNQTGSGQTKSASANQGGTVVFTIRIANDGAFASDGMTLDSAGNQSGMTATFKRGTTNITAQVVAGTYAIAPLAPGSSVDITLSDHVGNAVANGTVKSWLVAVTSRGAGAANDSVKATVTAS